MSLTREEQQQLNEIEVRLSMDAPDLERLLAPHVVAIRVRARETQRRLIRAAIFGLAAIVMLVTGICLNMVGLAVAAAAIMAGLPALMRVHLPVRLRGKRSGR